MASVSSEFRRQVFSFAVFPQERVHHLTERFHEAMLRAEDNPRQATRAYRILRRIYSELHGQASDEQKRKCQAALATAGRTLDPYDIEDAHLTLTEVLVSLGFVGVVRVVRPGGGDRLSNALLIGADGSSIIEDEIEEEEEE